MNQTKSKKETKGGWEFFKEKTSNLIKGLGAYFAIVLTNISLIIFITIVTNEQSLKINGLIYYLYISVLFLVGYSIATTKTVNDSIIHKILQIIKRFFDVVVAALGLFFLMPLLIILAISIKLESPGPILFHSKRVGQFGTIFDAYRFRTMYFDIAPKEFPITKVGNFLRRSSLNELPMLINVLNGELSLVGPWPRLPENLAETIDKENKILTIKPGLSGLWQISNTSPRESVEIDLKYIETWSLWEDVKIIVKTVFIVLKNK
jgi:lipopolysaccharide/colanic/teichoic acid biosynthesis glycosyltransferase